MYTAHVHFLLLTASNLTFASLFMFILCYSQNDFLHMASVKDCYTNEATFLTGLLINASLTGYYGLSCL